MPAFTITKVIREHVDVKEGVDGQTHGQLLDDLIETALYEGHEVQTIALEVSPEDWHAMRVAHDKNRHGGQAVATDSKTAKTRKAY